MDRRKIFKCEQEIKFICNELEDRHGVNEEDFEGFMEFYAEHHDYKLEVFSIHEDEYKGQYQIFCITPPDVLDYINNIDIKLWEGLDECYGETNMENWGIVACNCDLVTWGGNKITYYIGDAHTMDIREAYNYVFG